MDLACPKNRAEIEVKVHHPSRYSTFSNKRFAYKVGKGAALHKPTKTGNSDEVWVLKMDRLSEDNSTPREIVAKLV